MMPKEIDGNRRRLQILSASRLHAYTQAYYIFTEDHIDCSLLSESGFCTLVSELDQLETYSTGRLGW